VLRCPRNDLSANRLVRELVCPRNVLSTNGRVRELSCPRTGCPRIGLSAKSLVTVVWISGRLFTVFPLILMFSVFTVSCSTKHRPLHSSSCCVRAYTAGRPASILLSFYCNCIVLQNRAYITINLHCHSRHFMLRAR